MKPNLAELAALAGRPLSPAKRMDGAADRPRRRPRPASSRGRRRSWSRSARRGCWPRPGTAAGGPGRPPRWPGTPTGAGDAVAAALAHGLVLGRPWDERLRHAAALGAATAAAPVAGEFRRQDYLGALSAVAVEEVR